MTAGQLTWLIWLTAAAIGAIAYSRVKANPPTFLNRAVRIGFGGLVMLSVWTGTVYALWIAHASLAIGAIDNGEIAHSWWLPSVCILLAVLAHRTLNYRGDHE